MTRWSLVVSDETDQALRAFLGQTAAKKGALSAFVEKAVMDRLQRRERFHALVEQIQERNAHFDQQQIMDDIDAALAEVRADRS
jgi:hypothetical protein